VVKPKAVLVNIVLVLLAILAGYVVLEAGLRLYFFHSLAWPNSDLPSLVLSPHPVLGWRLKPDQVAAKDRLEYRGIIRINAKGLRDRAHDYERPAGMFRIVVLGDSFMEAASVDEQDSMAHLLEQQLADRNVEVINLGTEGYSTVQEYLYLKEEGLKYNPDLVLLTVYAENDVSDNSQVMAEFLSGKERGLRPYARCSEPEGRLVITPADFQQAQAVLGAKSKAERPWLRKLRALKRSLTSRIYKQILRAFKQKVFVPGHDPNIFLGAHAATFDPTLNRKKAVSADQYQRMWDDAWTTMDKTVAEIKSLAEDHGARLAMVTVPSKLEVESEYLKLVKKTYPGMTFDPDRAEQHLMQMGTSHEIPTLGLVKAFRETYESSGIPLFYSIDDSHWNVAGHYLAAQRVAQWLCNQTLVPQR